MRRLRRGLARAGRPTEDEVGRCMACGVMVYASRACPYCDLQERGYRRPRWVTGAQALCILKLPEQPERLDGLIGQQVRIPYLHESVIYLTGFRGVDIWFMPFPGQNFGGNANQFRIVELTGMKFSSLLKAELFMLPIVFGVSLMYWLGLTYYGKVWICRK